MRHRFGNGVGVLLICIAWMAHTIFEVHAGALLHDVRSFVRREPDVRRRPESDAIADCVAVRSELLVRGRRRAADLRLDPAQIATAKRRLDPIEVRERLVRAVNAAARQVVH